MADNLIFPIGFDLQKAVEEASQNWDKKYAKRLEQAIAKRPVRIKLEFEKLEDVKTRLAQLKIQPITPETRTAIRELAKELQVLAKALEQVQKFSKTTQLGQRNFTNDVQMEKLRQANERLEIQKRRVALAEQKHAEAMQRSATASRQLSSEFQNQDGYISRLLKRMAVYAGYSMATNFLTSVRDVTAEFELQRVSLGAIIQDQQRANQLFAEIKSFALTSPLKILDLTKYTKQVAAYGFETEKLFDTTKMLADISVGLGVDMSRLTLFLGQVYATGHLRASEVRQATEAGIPLVDKLAQKLTEANGRLVSAADVMDLISKRAISFEQVEEVFQDMTSAGGEFYNMQVKQSQTLYGMWSKLGDAAAIMYDQIGNTSTVNAGMKTTMGLLESMMRNWKTTARVLDTVSVALAVYVIGLKNAAVASTAMTTTEAARLAITNRQIIATPKLIAAIIGQNTATKLSTTLTKAHTVAMLNQSTATNVLSRGFWKLTAAMLANPWVAAAAGIALVVTALIHFIGNTETAAERAEKLNNSVASLKSLTSEVEPLIDTYKDLADKTERTADEQKKLNEVATELAQKFPAAITAIKEYGQEMGLAADEVARLYENMKRMKTEDVRQELTKNENAVKELIQRRQKLQDYFDKGEMWAGGGGTGGGGGAIVAMSEKERTRVSTLITDIDNQILELNRSIVNAKRELGDLPTEEKEAVEKFGAWKKKLTEFNKEVGGIKIRLFDDSTINQFGTLEEALNAAAKKYREAAASVEQYNKTLESKELKKASQDQIDRITAERDEAQATKDLSEEMLTFYNAMALVLKAVGGGAPSDNRLQNLQEIERTLTSINKKYEELAKTEGNTAAIEYVRKNYDSTLKYIKKLGEQFKLNFAMPTDFKDLQSYRKAIKDVIEQLEMEGYEKAAIELELKIAEGNQAQLQKEIQAKLKALADRISRTKTAKEFYEKILSQTGDVELAAKLSVSVYGQDGGSLQREIASQLSNALKGVTADGQTIGSDVFEEGVIDPNTLYINYTKLREIVDKQGDKLSDSQKKILDEMLKNGEAYNKAQVEQWAKDLAKVKDFTDQYIDLYRMTEKRKAEIRQKMASGELGEDAGKQEIAGYDARLVKEQSKIQYEMFKNSPMYTSLFENMENATVQSLHNMRSQIEKMMAVTKEPTQLKELQNRLNEIDETLAEKSPFEVIAKGWHTMGEMAKKYGSRSNLDNLIKQKQSELDALQAELDAALEKEAQTKQFAEMMGVDVQNPTTAITPVQKAALAAYQQASADVKNYGDAVKKADKEQQDLTDDATKWANAMGKVKKGLKTVVQIGQKLLQASEAAADFAEALGMSEDGLELFQDINNVISNTLNFADALIGCVDLMAKTTAESIKTVESASVILTVISAALQVATAIFNVFSNSKVRKANKEIERQQELLDQLEYTYGRLEKAADKVFGADFVANQKQQRKILLAQAEAYQKQYQAELSKGKKADEEKLKEFQEKYRDTMDAIADMEGQVAERMLGTDLTSAARDFANAWLEAYKEFGNTADAMSEKFHEMIQNMIVESLLAKVMERALKPAFDMIDNMNEEDFYSESFWKKVMATAEQGAKDADHGAGVVMKWIEQMGYDMREMGSEYSGIAKEVSSANSEEINRAAAIGNSLLYYASTLPTMATDLSLIRQLMERGTTSTLPDTTAAGWTDWQQQAMDNYIAIQRNTADTVVECRRAANACEGATEKLNRALRAKGATIGFNVFLNS